jgi:hypothetical protein
MKVMLAIKKHRMKKVNDLQERNPPPPGKDAKPAYQPKNHDQILGISLEYFVAYAEC